MQYVITLVHGTWAPRAAWVQSSSALWTRLVTTLPDTVIRPFSWTGKNSVAARHRATDALRGHLRGVLAEYPEARHFVIAHSHGGNIALYALRDIELARQIQRVICLGTPFFHVRRRRPPRPQERLAVGFGLLGGCVLPLMSIVTWLWFALVGPEHVFVFLLLALSSQVLLFLTPRSQPVRAVGARWREWAERVHGACTFPTLPAAKLLIIRTSADEPSAALASAQFISWFVRRAWQSAASRFERMSVLRMFAIFGGGIIAAIFLVGVEGVGGPLGALSEGLFVLWMLVMLWHFLPGWVSFAVLPFLLLWSTPLAFFGWELVLASPLMDVSVEPTPPGQFSVSHFAPTEQPPSADAESRGPDGLLHSSSYEDPRALGLLTQWILEQRPMRVQLDE